MAVGRISGPLLKSNLLRQGVDLAFETDLLYLDVTNRRIGVKTNAPAETLDINGSARIQTLDILDTSLPIGNITINGNNSTIDTSASSITLGTPGKVIIGKSIKIDRTSGNGSILQIVMDTITTSPINSCSTTKPKLLF